MSGVHEGVSHHRVHGKVVVLRLQLHSVLVCAADLSVTLQEQFFVVADPVKHLHRNDNMSNIMNCIAPSCLGALLNADTNTAAHKN